MTEYLDKAAIKGKSVYSLERHELVVPVAEIDWMPPTKVEPIIEAEWVKESAGSMVWWECSHCHGQPLERNGRHALSRRCPHCGAHMSTGLWKPMKGGVLL